MSLRKRRFVMIICVISFCNIYAQLIFPTKNESSQIQFFKPENKDLFVGDPMPFYKSPYFHIFWLLDQNHHEGMNGLGGHIWAHSISTDLKSWKHYKNSIEITDKEEKSICTGSVIYYDGLYYAFYALRTDINGDGKKEEFLKLATSKNGIDFEKTPESRFKIVPDTSLSQMHFRDPFVYYDSDKKHFLMIVSTAKKNTQPNTTTYGLLVYYVSKNLRKWKYMGTYLEPNLGFIPECPDLFKWGNTYFLLYTPGGGTRYAYSDSPYGPWKMPSNNNLGCDYAYVYKTATFNYDRKIAVGFVPSKENSKNDGAWQYAGNMILKELIREKDNQLSFKQVEELIQTYSKELTLDPIEVNEQVKQSIPNVPTNARLKANIQINKPNSIIEWMIRVDDKGYGYPLKIDLEKNELTLSNSKVNFNKIQDLNIELDIVMQNDIIDVCVNGVRCITNRCPEYKGNKINFYAYKGAYTIKECKISELKSSP
ncbi:MAG: hypothetical protein SFY32_09250 [Bacteroidota bacterium]|nr:hypothetical protein [Bacteroidota bacterium]